MGADNSTNFENQDHQWMNLWAKTRWNNRNFNTTDCHYHPLIFHMLDVAAVAGLIWDNCLTPQLCKRLEFGLGKNTRGQIVFLSGMHDLGKCSPGFQNKVPEISQYSGLPFSVNDQNRPHGFVSAHILHQIFGHNSAAAILAQIAGGHHGIFPQSCDLRMGQDTLGNISWDEARKGLIQEFSNIVNFDLNSTIRDGSEITDPMVIPLLAGLISVADWIGSNQDFFPCVAEHGKVIDNAAEYWNRAKKQARHALNKLGWLPAVVFAKEDLFNSIFPMLSTNQLQDAMIKLVSKETSPYLIIVEAPMGQGKTEAALYAADMAMCRGFARGMYIAMPTQATGNTMFRRVLCDYLQKRGHRGKLNLQLVHSDAILAQMNEVHEGEIPAFEPHDIREKDGDIEAQSWFTAKKRPLLAPFGVGTIDQSLLSVLQTKHWFVRLFGLLGKVVIFDEIHAYDAYMSTIIERLLHWLAEVDCTVILLSATLPDAKRKALTKAYSGRDDGEYKRYPRITLAKSRKHPNMQADICPECTEISIENNRSVNLSYAMTDLSILTCILQEKLENGGCAAIICNTVNNAISTYQHLSDNLNDTECLLFHARTLKKWRKEWEMEVLSKFGKGIKQIDETYSNSRRPLRAVLVATQVIEQSLDLDFDLMISEIAPVDLLLQRCGRLHRHLRKRPIGLETPQLIVLCNGLAIGPPPKSFGESIEYIYDRYILLLTWLTLRDRKTLEVPREIEALVEAVYGERTQIHDDCWNTALVQARKQMEDARSESEKNASRLLINHPKHPGDLIEDFNDQLADDEDPDVHESLRAATREGDPSISVVMLEQGVALQDEPSISDVRFLLDRSVKLNHRGIFNALLTGGESPKEWNRSAHLKYARLLRLDNCNQGKIGRYILTVDRLFGVVITKAEE